MLNRRIAEFESLVWSTAARIGRRTAGPITDAILRVAFPRTAAEADIEGADKMLRHGVHNAVNEILRKKLPAADQYDFASIDETFAPIVRKLGSKAYYVESLDEQVPVPELIAKPALLDDARRYMRRKGHECLAEARILDELYTAVTARITA